MAANPGIRARLVNFLIASVATLVAMAAAEPVLRMRYVEPVPATPPAVLEVQPWLRLDPDVGYTWKPDVSADQHVLFHNADIEPVPLSTDEFGVINAPDAVRRRQSGEAVRVLGLGDSFMEMAAHGFYDAIGPGGGLYYSLAIHRHAPPHYARMFETYGVSLNPEVVVVGLFENDFAETKDFDDWQRSGLDWFTYHSGTWCGRTVPVTAFGRFTRTYFPGYQGLARVIRARVRGDRMSVSGPTEAQVRRVTDELARMADAAERGSIDMWLLLIPSKPTARGETTAEARAYDRVADALRPRLAGIVDLRPVFQAHPDPSSLYYREDGHWNGAGVALAARELLGRLPVASVVDESRSD